MTGDLAAKQHIFHSWTFTDTVDNHITAARWGFLTPKHPIQELLPTVAAAGSEMPVTGTVKSPQTFGYDRSL